MVLCMARDLDWAKSKISQSSDDHDPYTGTNQIRHKIFSPFYTAMDGFAASEGRQIQAGQESNTYRRTTRSEASNFLMEITTQ